ncbi:MAG: hypothetical protein ROR55_03380 [Devosia sp.]
MNQYHPHDGHTVPSIDPLHILGDELGAIIVLENQYERLKAPNHERSGTLETYRDNAIADLVFRRFHISEAITCFPASDAKGAMLQAAVALEALDVLSGLDTNASIPSTVASTELALTRLLSSIRNYLEAQCTVSLADWRLSSLRSFHRDPWERVEERLSSLGIIVGS